MKQARLFLGGSGEKGHEDEPCPDRCRHWVTLRTRWLCCLLGPSVLLATCAWAGLLQSSPGRSRNPEVLVGVPYRRHDDYFLSSFVGGDAIKVPSRFPWQLIAMGKASSLDTLPSSVRGNIENTLALNPGMKLRYLSDSDCHDYILGHFDAELADLYQKEKAGHFRGDICRAAVLLREGGYYTDVDLQAKAPFAQLVDNSTDFMSVFTLDGAILNAMIATAPGSSILNVTLHEIRRWYRGTEGSLALEEHAEGEWMGTVTLRRGMEAFLKDNCPGSTLADKRSEQTLQWACGHHALRFYQEDRLDCWGGFYMEDSAGDAAKQQSEECPEERRNSFFEGLQYGIFVPGTRQIVAWPRVVSCQEWWCGGR